MKQTHFPKEDSDEAIEKIDAGKKSIQECFMKAIDIVKNLKKYIINNLHKFFTKSTEH